jgi:hypothetical protein
MTTPSNLLLSYADGGTVPGVGQQGTVAAESEYLSVMIAGEKHFFELSAHARTHLPVMGAPGGIERRAFIKAAQKADTMASSVSSEYAKHLEARESANTYDDSAVIDDLS